MAGKSPAIITRLDQHAFIFWGRTRTDSLARGCCVKCGGKADEFRDTISLQEYLVSGFCQACQDKFFGS